MRGPAEKVIKDIRRATRKRRSSEENIRIVLEGLRGEDSIAELCRRTGSMSLLGLKPGAGQTTSSECFGG